MVARHGLSASPRPDSSRFFRIGVRDPEGQCWRRGEWRFGDRAVRGRARAAGRGAGGGDLEFSKESAPGLILGPLAASREGAVEVQACSFT